MTSAGSRQYIKALLASGVAVIVWLLTVFVINLSFWFINPHRGELVFWFARNVLSPGVAAALALAAAEKAVTGETTGRLGIGFALAVVFISVAGSVNNYSIYAGTGRFEEWYAVLVATIASALAAIVGAFVYVRRNM